MPSGCVWMSGLPVARGATSEGCGGLQNGLGSGLKTPAYSHESTCRGACAVGLELERSGGACEVLREMRHLRPWPQGRFLDPHCTASGLSRQE